MSCDTRAATAQVAFGNAAEVLGHYRIQPLPQRAQAAVEYFLVAALPVLGVR
jgi:hypothetical protein